MDFYHRARAAFDHLLRKTERFTKTDMVFAARTGFWSIVAQIASSFAALALALIVARVVAKSEYGDYQYVLSIVSILSIFSLSGLGGALLQSVARGFDQSLWDGFWLNLRWSFGVVLGAVIVGSYYLYHGNATLGIAILVAGLASPLSGSLNLYGWFLNGKKDIRRSSLYPNLIGNVVPIFGIIAGALLFHTSLALIVGYVTANILTLAALFWRTTKIYPLNNQHDTGLKRYGFHLSGIGVLNTIAGNLGNLLLFHFLGASDVAVYNFAVSVPDQTNGPISATGNMMTARFSSRAPVSIREGILNKMFWLLLLNGGIVLVYALFAPLIYHVLFPTYSASIDYSRIYIISLLSNVFIPAGAFLGAHKCVREQYISSAFTSTLQIVAMVVGVIFFGIWGLILARVVARLANGVMVQFLYLRASKRITNAALPI